MFQSNQSFDNQLPDTQLPGNQPPKFKLPKLPTLNKNTLLIGAAVLAILVTGILVLENLTSINVLSFFKLGNSPATVANMSVDYINKNVLQQGQVATLVSFSEVSGVVKMTIKIGESTYDSYATKDGKLLFPEAFTMTPTTTAPITQPTGQQTPVNVAKVANTSLEAFVVSGCPYGLQMQRAIANAIKNVPSLAQYITVRYIGAVSGNTITAMHGVEEAQENLRQICIRDEQNDKYWDYVSCYMQKATGSASNGMPYGDTKTCQTVAGIDTAKLNACVASPARGVAYAKEDFALNTKHNIQGSPTLLLNGAVTDETPFGGRSADGVKNIICDSSTNPPSFCTTKLDTTPATTSFSLTYAGSGATATANTNCAPTVQ